MDFKELKDKASLDLKMDITNLAEESLKTPIIYSKWVDLYVQFSLVHKKLDGEYKKLYKEKWHYYAGWAEEPYSIGIDKPSEIKMHVESNDEIITIVNKMALVQEKIRYVDKIANAISKRGFEIKSAIDYMKFQSGL